LVACNIGNVSLVFPTCTATQRLCELFPYITDSFLRIQYANRRNGVFPGEFESFQEQVETDLPVWKNNFPAG
jgi:hypothetical protein